MAAVAAVGRLPRLQRMVRPAVMLTSIESVRPVIASLAQSVRAGGAVLIATHILAAVWHAVECRTDAPCSNPGWLDSDNTSSLLRRVSNK